MHPRAIGGAACFDVCLVADPSRGRGDEQAVEAGHQRSGSTNSMQRPMPARETHGRTARLREGCVAEDVIESTSGVLAALLPQRVAVGDNQKLDESAYAFLTIDGAA